MVPGSPGPSRGRRIDQIVLSSETYLTVAPGALKNDTQILK
jgi:hypothetical protein